MSVVIVATAKYSVYEVFQNPKPKPEPESEPESSHGIEITDVKARLLLINLIQCIYAAYHKKGLTQTKLDGDSKAILGIAKMGYSGCECISIMLDGNMQPLQRDPRPYDVEQDEEEMEKLFDIHAEQAL